MMYVSIVAPPREPLNTTVFPSCAKRACNTRARSKRTRVKFGGSVGLGRAIHAAAPASAIPIAAPATHGSQRELVSDGGAAAPVMPDGTFEVDVVPLIASSANAKSFADWNR